MNTLFSYELPQGISVQPFNGPGRAPIDAGEVSEDEVAGLPSRQSMAASSRAP